MPYNKHLDLESRKIIETGLDNKSSKTSIAKTLGKDPSTICKEIKNHRIPIERSTFVTTTDCLNFKNCPHKTCVRCSNYSPSPCVHLDKAGVCNGCDLINSVKCKKQKYRYSALKAQEEYKNDLIDSRVGVNLTTSEAKRIGNIIKPLIDNGQSLYVIIKNHPEIGICEKTLYNYIESGVFSSNGIIDLNLRRKVSMRIPKSKRKKTICSKPREMKKFLKGRTMKDFDNYIASNPEVSIVEMDTVYNDETNGPFIQTFYICPIDIMIGIYHNEKSSQEMINGFNKIYEMLGDSLFEMYFQVIKTDRGTEFSNPEEYEKLGAKIFYCDPMCSWQKPHVERAHELFRFICPKEKDLHLLGLASQEDVNLIFSHINSYAREELKGKSPFDIYLFFSNNNTELIDKLGLSKIDQDKVNLTPSLIRK